MAASSRTSTSLKLEKSFANSLCDKYFDLSVMTVLKPAEELEDVKDWTANGNPSLQAAHRIS